MKTLVWRAWHLQRRAVLPGGLALGFHGGPCLLLPAGTFIHPLGQADKPVGMLGGSVARPVQPIPLPKAQLCALRIPQIV